MGTGDIPEKVLESVDEPRRGFLRKLVLGSAFVVPSVASFSMAGLDAAEAAVACSNQFFSNFSGQNLHGQDLSRCFFIDVNFSGANLSGANLKQSVLRSCDFSGANLNGANLQGANLMGANLTGANLNNANLTGANLVGAKLTGANLHGVTWNTTTCPDNTNSNNDGGTCLGHL